MKYVALLKELKSFLRENNFEELNDIIDYIDMHDEENKKKIESIRSHFYSPS